MDGGADGDVVIVEPEAHLVARLDAELISQLLGDDDLPFGADTVSHTIEYNLHPTWTSGEAAAAEERGALHS